MKRHIKKTGQVFSSVYRSISLAISSLCEIIVGCNCGLVGCNSSHLVAQLLYASPAWWGFLKADEKSRLLSVINQAQRYGYLPIPFRTMDQLRQDLDETLFHSSRYNPHHVLHRLLPQPKDTGHNLRQRAHNLTLPSDVSSTAKQNFIPRMLFADMYLYYVPNVYTCYCVCYSLILVYILYYL